MAVYSTAKFKRKNSNLSQLFLFYADKGDGKLGVIAIDQSIPVIEEPLAK